MRWELKTIHGPREGSALDAVPLGVALAELLDQGWEPFGVVDRGAETWVFLKRPADVLREVPEIRTIPGIVTFDERAFLRSRRRQKKTARAKAARGKTR